MCGSAGESVSLVNSETATPALMLCLESETQKSRSSKKYLHPATTGLRMLNIFDSIGSLRTGKKRVSCNGACWGFDTYSYHKMTCCKDFVGL